MTKMDVSISKRLGMVHIVTQESQMTAQQYQPIKPIVKPRRQTHGLLLPLILNTVFLIYGGRECTQTAIGKEDKRMGN